MSFFNMHSSWSKETGCVVIGLGLGGRGHDTQTCQWRQVRGDQTNPVRPLLWRAPQAPPPEGNLANYKLLTKKKSNI